MNETQLMQYAVAVNNEPGQLHRVTQALADHGVGVLALAAEATGYVGRIRFLAERGPLVRAAMEKHGFPLFQSPASSVLLHNRPGELARFTRALSDGGVNIRSAYMTVGDGQHGRVMLSVDQPERTQRLLGGTDPKQPLALI